MVKLKVGDKVKFEGDKHMIVNFVDGFPVLVPMDVIDDDLDALITDIYDCELENNSFDVVKGWFFENYKVFVSDSNIKEVVN